MSVLEHLRAASSGVRAADGDAIAGVPARFVAAPASTEEAGALLRAAAAHGLVVVARGGGSKQDWGAPPARLDLIVETHRLSGIVEHAAGDLVVVVRAGTPMAELQDKLAATGQQLALDTPLPATVGGTVAADVSGPRRMAYGTVRDLLIGVTMVRADGVVARSGGKVVKNVAGYDLGKLLTGSYGTLGLITECAFRLHPRPAASAVLRRAVADPAAAGALVAAVRQARLVPGAIEIDAPPEGGVEVAVRLDGVPDGLAARVAVVKALLGGRATESEPDWWGRYPWPPGGVGLKLTAALSRVPGLLAAAIEARERLGVPLSVRGSAGVGVLYAGLPGDTTEDAVVSLLETLRAAAHDAGGHAVVLTAPPPVRERLDLWGPVPGLELMRRLKDQFDPGARFAPGRFVGGI